MWCPDPSQRRKRMSIGLLSNIFTLFGGLGMFLYGMTVMSDGMQKAAGSKMSGFIDMVTKNRFMAVLLGAGITALIQSSSATTVMVVGFVNAGVLNLSQSVGIIMGANIGTTITAWMVSLTQVSSDMLAILKPEFFAPVLIGFGAFRMLLGKKGTDDLGGTICMGVGLIFIGLQFMGKAVEPYADSPMFATAFLLFGRNPVLGILAGAIITGIIQSSAASVSILQTLALAGAVPRASGFYITLGQNIGTCVTAMISSTGTSRTAKRAACIHLLFNVTGAVIFGVVIFAASLFQPAFFSSNLTPVEISIFHTIFNVSCTLILFPFGDALVKMSDILVRKEKVQDTGISTQEELAEHEEQRMLRHLDDRMLESPAIAISATRTEVVNLGRIVSTNIAEACESMAKPDDARIQEVYGREKLIDRMTHLLTNYLIRINQLSLSDAQKLDTTVMMNIITDVERIGDYAENISEKAEYMRKNGITFSDVGQKDLRKISLKAQESMNTALNAYEDNDLDRAILADRLEDQVDEMERSMRKSHMERLANGECNTSAGVVFLDVISYLERVSDHGNNVAGYVVDRYNTKKKTSA